MPQYKRPLKKDDSPKIICQNKECISMGKYQSINNFYKSRNDKMPNHPYCKDCVSKMIDENDMQTVYDVLKSLDTPFIMDAWNKSCLRGTKNTFGEYLKIINFTERKKYEGLRFEDGIYELSEEAKKISEEVQSQIDEIPVWNEDFQGNYTKKDLEYLNKYFIDLKNDFKITTRNHEDYARKIAQASLTVNKAFAEMQQGIDKADTRYKNALSNFDMLSKSAQFAESQRGANDVSLGCFGKVFDAVEKHNWIPKYVPKEDEKDIYDKLLEQFANIEKSL